jgi:hypothetical protein
VIDVARDDANVAIADARRSTVVLGLLTAAVVVAAVVFAGSIVQAILSQIQSDYLGNRSEASGGFDPTVFPPFDVLTWLMAIATPVLTGSLLVIAVLTRILAQRTIGQTSRA